MTGSRRADSRVPADSRGAYRATDFSLAAILNMQYLDNLTEEIGRVSDDRTPAHAMLAQHAVGRFLKEQGYRYYHIGAWFEATASIPIADENLSFDTTSEFESVLRDTTIVPAIEQLAGVQTPETTFRDRHREGTLFAFRQLHRLATAPGPKFVFAHVLLPHDPYVFRADGSVIPEEDRSARRRRTSTEATWRSPTRTSSRSWTTCCPGPMTRIRSSSCRPTRARCSAAASTARRRAWNTQRPASGC